MWTKENRGCYDRSQQRDPSDLTAEEWALVAPLIPPAKRGGGKRRVDLREVVNGIMYILSTGCPSASSGGGRGSIRAAMMPATLRQAQEINGKKRHIAVDTLGLNLEAAVHPADIRDRDGGPLVLKELRPLFPLITKIIADGGYQGPQMAAAVAAISREWEIEIVKRPELKKFVALPKRWVVERTFAWLNRCRRLAKDFESLTRNALAFLRLASIRLMLRRLCNPS